MGCCPISCPPALLGVRTLVPGTRKTGRFQRVPRSPLTDSNRRPLPYHARDPAEGGPARTPASAGWYADCGCISGFADAIRCAAIHHGFGHGCPNRGTEGRRVVCSADASDDQGELDGLLSLVAGDLAPLRKAVAQLPQEDTDVVLPQLRRRQWEAIAAPSAAWLVGLAFDVLCATGTVRLPGSWPLSSRSPFSPRPCLAVARRLRPRPRRTTRPGWLRKATGRRRRGWR
jgi:hypothetical protein